MTANSKGGGDINTVTNSGSVGAMAVGTNATAIQAGGDVFFNKEAFDTQVSVLKLLIKEHEHSDKLSGMLEKALEAIALGDAEKSKPLWEKIIEYGAPVSAIAANILSLLFP